MRKELPWIIPGSILIALEYAVAFVIGSQVGFSYRLALDEQLAVAGVLSAGVAGVIFLLALGRCLWRQVKSPVAQMRADLPKALPIMVGISLVALQIGVLNWTKSMIPLISPFWADAALASVDRRLLGADAWIYLHALPAPFIDAIYSAWAPIKFLTLLVVFCHPASRTKTRALTAYFLTMFFGLIGQYLLPSAGPIFYDRLGLGDRFDGIHIPYLTKLASDYLWAAYSRGGGEVGAGISAFPSMHVAIALWIALTVGSFNRRLGALAFVYFTVIWFGSIYLGWHYVMDGIGGIAITLTAWGVANGLMSLKSRRAGFGEGGACGQGASGSCPRLARDLVEALECAERHASSRRRNRPIRQGGSKRTRQIRVHFRKLR